MNNEQRTTSMNHTPGPWHIVADPQWDGKHPVHSSRFICNVPEFAEVYPPTPGEDDGWQVFHDEGGQTICRMTDTIEIAANARLIAAAPELLRALELGLRNIEDIESNDELNEHERAFADAARAAIAKARGDVE